MSETTFMSSPSFFFTSESVRSQQTLVQPEQRLTDAIAAGVEAALTVDTARAS